jgi:uncharacterized membrane protein HdeD (DUF308 family)
MKTVGNDLVRHQLHENRKWYLGLGILLTLFGIVLLASLPFATLSAVFLFGALMMIGGIIHFIAAFKIFDGGFRWLWALFGVLYLVAGYYAFTTPVKTAIVLTNILAIILIVAGVIRLFNAFIFRAFQGWGLDVVFGYFNLADRDHYFDVTRGTFLGTGFISCRGYFISGYQLFNFGFVY